MLRTSTGDFSDVEAVHTLLIERADSSLLDFKGHHNKPNNVVEFAYFVKLLLEQVRDRQLGKLDRKVDGLGLSRHELVFINAEIDAGTLIGVLEVT
ncbi:hypothetical protein NQ176_g10813 [Zarea fungicola]|uniref:Uncharacterized protein n=1 Tax=Zarea fungicola TaxID=93591 RepID=A0ACC1MDE8_9HYPO|nr:hypothetical protein NQ176_g10813 [Lecanicillium fungicola]